MLGTHEGAVCVCVCVPHELVAATTRCPDDDGTSPGGVPDFLKYLFVSVCGIGGS